MRQGEQGRVPTSIVSTSFASLRVVYHLTDASAFQLRLTR